MTKLIGDGYTECFQKIKLISTNSFFWKTIFLPFHGIINDVFLNVVKCPVVSNDVFIESWLPGKGWICGFQNWWNMIFTTNCILGIQICSHHFFYPGCYRRFVSTDDGCQVFGLGAEFVLRGTTQFHVIGGDAMHCVPTNHMKLCGAPQNKFGPQSKNLASVIRGYKSSVTTRVKKMMAANLNTQNTIGCENHVSSILKTANSSFAWQPRFYEHIIRNDRAFYNIQKYIVDNPMKWQEDRFSKKWICAD